MVQHGRSEGERVCVSKADGGRKKPKVVAVVVGGDADSLARLARPLHCAGHLFACARTVIR